MKYAFIEKHRVQHPIATMCRVIRVSRSGFYAWVHKPLSDRAIEDQRLLQLIRTSYQASGGIYGSPRIFEDLRETGETCGHNRVARIMRQNKIKAIRGYKTPRHRYGRPAQIAPNRLEQNFTVDQPNKVWVTDIERHEALSYRAVMRMHRPRAVAADRVKLRAA